MRTVNRYVNNKPLIRIILLITKRKILLITSDLENCSCNEWLQSGNFCGKQYDNYFLFSTGGSRHFRVLHMRVRTVLCVENSS